MRFGRDALGRLLGLGQRARGRERRRGFAGALSKCVGGARGEALRGRDGRHRGRVGGGVGRGSR